LNRANRQRLTEAIEAGLRLGGGTIAIESLKKNKSNIRNEEAEKTEKGQIIPYSEEFACPEHGAFLPEMSPRVFSFNNPLGACPNCQGLGVKREFSPDLVIDRTASVEDGCIRPF